MKTIFANSKDALREKTFGLYHDHCHHKYVGEVNNVPKEYLKYVKGSKYKYVFMYEEDEPVKKEL